VRGEPSLAVIDADGDLSGNYKLDATITVEKGEAKAYVSTADREEKKERSTRANRYASTPS
jgi:hypothetical protein